MHKVLVPNDICPLNICTAEKDDSLIIARLQYSSAFNNRNEEGADRAHLLAPADPVQKMRQQLRSTYDIIVLLSATFWEDHIKIECAREYPHLLVNGERPIKDFDDCAMVIASMTDVDAAMDFADFILHRVTSTGYPIMVFEESVYNFLNWQPSGHVIDVQLAAKDGLTETIVDVETGKETATSTMKSR